MTASANADREHVIRSEDLPGSLRCAILPWLAASTHRGIIFIAEDEATFRALLQEALEDSGYLVLPARSGTEALARMHGFSGTALAIVDLNMPGMNGWELIEAMRADDDLKHIRILVVSSCEPPPVPGADRQLQKPLKLKDLLRTVAELTA